MSKKETTKNLWFAYRRNQAKVSFSIVYKAKKKIAEKNVFIRKRGSGRLSRKQKEGFLTALAAGIKNDPTKSIIKPANELKVQCENSN